VEKENLSVIMSVSIDHTNFLGNTVEEIAKQKAGIFRENSICILYPNPECEKIFENTCNKLNSKLIKVKDYGNIADNNLATVNAVLSALNCNTKAETLVRLPARQEKINGVLIDGGHNPSSAKYLAKCISDEVAVIGMMADKDVDKFLSLIAPKCKKVITTTPDNPRAISAVELKTIAEKYCDNVVAIDNPKEAVLQEGITLVCGSFFLARDVRNIINNM
jgi:dihydrofolate synthase/folylpolyglutamate synthase